ncbi:MAG: maleylpyruvate isomerase N-terminal domain-containing protein [Pirellulaceae bacterium]
MNSMPPILIGDLFRELSVETIRLLIRLTPDEWTRSTVSSERTVKDIASHLLDGSLRRLSCQRDHYTPPPGVMTPRTDESLVDFLHRLNAEWETATRRLSPHVIVNLLEWAHDQTAILFESLDPFGPAIFPVSWLGDTSSLNWMDIAREYTEKWHHTQQIFEATGHPSRITTRRMFHPCLDTFLRALPYTYRQVPAAEGAVVAVEITGEAGGFWFIQRQGEQWQQVAAAPGAITSRVVLDQESAWKLFTKRRNHADIRHQFANIYVEGDRELGSYVLDMVSVVA